MTDERLKFIVRTDLKRKKDEKCPVNIRVTMNSKTLKLSTGVCILIEDWNSNAGFPKKRKDLDKYKSLLRKKMRIVEDFMNDCDRYGKAYTLKDIKNHYNNGAKKSFFDFYWDFYRKKSKDISEGTLYVYEVLGKQLEEFNPNLKLGDITYDFLSDFFYFLKTQKKVNNLFNKRKCLVAFLTEMKKGGHIKENVASEISLPKQKLKEVFLTKEELSAFSDVDVSGLGMEVTKDVFEFCCYTGLRYGDAFNLTKDDISNNTLRIEQGKVKAFVDIPLMERALEILKKYDYENSKGKIFPNRENQTCNRDVKIIAKKAGIKKNLTFHISRHTFGTRLAENSMNAFHIQELMGHGSIRTTERYIKTNKQILSKAMKNVSFV